MTRPDRRFDSGRRIYALGIAALLLSSVAIAVQADSAWSGSAIGSVCRAFAWPGTTIWWLVLGGPFQTAPSTLAGAVFAIIANAACWLAVAALTGVTARFARSKFGGR